jgi:YidC/Oxa1 family membrane protein insertase
MTKHNIRFQAVNPQFTALMKRLNEAKQTRDQAQMAVVTQNLQGLMKEHDVSPFRAFTLPLVQMPFFLSMFYGLRNFAYTPLPQLKEGGFSWVTDLTMSDPYWILPITSMALTNLVLIVRCSGSDYRDIALTYLDRCRWNFRRSEWSQRQAHPKFCSSRLTCRSALRRSDASSMYHLLSFACAHS